MMKNSLPGMPSSTTTFPRATSTLVASDPMRLSSALVQSENRISPWVGEVGPELRDWYAILDQLLS